ncbi:hypothetical protein A4A49_33033 [Nicotiana attenuata]|uniref:Sulfite exporter TauE/SafE family protein 3 n=1 Tax=Nicotiana attenuata TaxID=49451 RepID=A0A1J6IYG2_NICAT|nr:hypothetical protein A4A49_33033 [Nicotiana attenuata]
MITGAAGATVFYNLKLRHPRMDMPIIDYNLALLFQPMLLLGISIGVVLNVLFAEWMVTVLLIILFIGAGDEEVAYKLLPEGPNKGSRVEKEVYKATEVPIVDNVYWKDITALIGVWIVILVLHISKNYSSTCTVAYWSLNFLQVPVAVRASVYQAVCLYKGSRVIMSSRDAVIVWKVHHLILCCCCCCCCGILAGIVGGLLGLGGGLILGPLLLELGIPPHLIFHFALYFVAITTIPAFVGQNVVRKIISIVGRASVIIFVLAFTIFVSALSLGGVGILDTIKKVEEGQHIGFDNICAYNS